MFDFMVDDLKRDPPVSTDGNAPCASTVPGKLVHAPAGRALHLAQVSRQDQHGDNFAYSLDKIRTEPLAVIVLDKTSQAPVPYTAYIHIYYCTQIPYTYPAFLELYAVQAGYRGGDMVAAPK